MLPLYESVVALGRDPAWYREGQVPDTIDGRFDVIAAVTALVLLRLEREPDRETRLATTLLTELFIDDMEGSLRQIGIGDLVVGKQMGRLMGALGGRLGALRDARDEPEMRAAVTRNIFHETPPSEEAVAFVTARLLQLRADLEASEREALLDGKVPAL
jgi:cytochrome b pre-mRNA-processing protein 3